MTGEVPAKPPLEGQPSREEGSKRTRANISRPGDDETAARDTSARATDDNEADPASHLGARCGLPFARMSTGMRCRPPTALPAACRRSRGVEAAARSLDRAPPRWEPRCGTTGGQRLASAPPQEKAAFLSPSPPAIRGPSHALRDSTPCVCHGALLGRGLAGRGAVAAPCTLVTTAPLLHTLQRNNSLGITAP